METLLKLEDQVIAALKHPAIARLLFVAFGVVGVVAAQRPDLNWPKYALGIGTALGLYGSVHRAPAEPGNG